jgi:hypothetical protein
MMANLPMAQYKLQKSLVMFVAGKAAAIRTRVEMPNCEKAAWAGFFRWRRRFK